MAQDYAQALKWCRKAAEQGHADAQYILGFMYETGEGVTQDYTQAYMWYNLAIAQKDEVATARDKFDIDELAKSMTPDQIAEAQRLAREWTEKHSK